MPASKRTTQTPTRKRPTLVDATHDLLRAHDVLVELTGDGLRDPVSVAAMAASAVVAVHNAIRGGDLVGLRAISRIRVGKGNAGAFLLVEADHILALARVYRDGEITDPQSRAQWVGKAMTRAAAVIRLGDADADDRPDLSDEATSDRIERGISERFAREWQANRAMSVTPGELASWTLEACGFPPKKRSALLKFASMRRRRGAG